MPNQSPTPTPFTIEIPDEAVGALRDRLRSARLAPDFANDDWGYGMERTWLAGMLEYWAEEFDWRAQEARLNALPHYRVVIDGVPVHFVWVRSGDPHAIPLILTHGWPWTFLDWIDTIGPLTDPAAHGSVSDISFDIIIPSLPGFGFSSPLDKPIGCRDVAHLWDTLMREHLGYETYGVAGGDWGGKVSAEIGQLFPEHVIGAYSTLQAIPGSTPPLDATGRFADDEAWMVDRMRKTTPLVLSHLAVHRHDPQTLAYALNDSPAGLAAWIWERRISWSDPLARDEVMADRDFLCTTASIYWFTETIGTSMRFYRENFGDRIPAPVDVEQRSITPMGYGILPRDILFMPRREVEEQLNLQHWSMLSRGGHFSAYEIPAELSADIHAFFGKVRGP